MRVVLDTSVLVRAPRADSPARAVFDRLLAAPHVLLSSSFILDELDRAMRYPRLRRVHGLADADIDRHVRDVGDAASLVNLPATAPNIVVSDPQDDPIVATAVHGQAEVLCTLDRHLRHPTVVAYCAQFHIRVLSDVELLDELRTAENQK